jgi:hypothetical protein
MERIQALIDKLYQQKQQNSNPAQLLFTVQLLQSELLKLQQKNGSMNTGKVAVTLPANMNFSEEMMRTVVTVEPKKEEVSVLQETVKEEVPVYLKEETSQPEPLPTYDQLEYILRKPSVIHEKPEKEEPAPAPKAQVLNPAFDTFVETPTLSQHQIKKEVNEVIAEQKPSLNDRLKQDKVEVAHLLKDTPIKDLRKAIGINDRFTFVSELFRGDEAMYERSIKTINGFHILSEAEYWISRELKLKLGWDDNKEAVQHFYHLVRRRFS